MARQATATAVSPMQVYGDASLDAPNGSQIHCINLTVHLTLTRRLTLGVGLALKATRRLQLYAAKQLL